MYNPGVSHTLNPLFLHIRNVPKAKLFQEGTFFIIIFTYMKYIYRSKMTMEQGCSNVPKNYGDPPKWRTYTQSGLISNGPISKTSKISGFFKQ